MSSSENLVPVEASGDESLNWYPINSALNDFEVVNTFGYDSGVDSSEGRNQRKKNLMKLSLLNYAKRVPVNVGSSVLKNYIFNLISKNLIASSDVVKTCVDFILDKKFSNKMILEINSHGEIIKYYTDLIGCSELNIINQNISEILKGFSVDFLEGIQGKFLYSNFEMPVSNIGNVEIQIHLLETKHDYFILLRY